MQALCCLDAQGDDAMDLALAFIRDGHDELDVLSLAREMTQQAWGYRDQADARLAERSERWDVHRMPVVDRSILRLAVWELGAQNAPAKVVINEALRLAKEFSTAQSPRFINGVLDAIAGDLGGTEGESS